MQIFAPYSTSMHEEDDPSPFDEMRRPSLFPVVSPDGRPNCKQLVIIQRDGSAVLRAMLEGPEPAHREQLICLHYLSHSAKHFIRENVSVRFVARDDPWDFEIEMSNGCSFNLEITAIADNERRFRTARYEERFAFWSRQESIPLRELRKLADQFPNEHTEQQISAHLGAGTKPGAWVPNPFRSDGPILFHSGMMPPARPLETLIREAIQRKLDKPHLGKPDTSIIVDNRTAMYDGPDFFTAAANLRSWLGSLPFPDVWIYTGYFSDDSGQEAEYSFMPFKTTGEKWNRLQELAEQNGLKDGERLIWSHSE